MFIFADESVSESDERDAAYTFIKPRPEIMTPAANFVNNLFVNFIKIKMEITLCNRILYSIEYKCSLGEEKLWITKVEQISLKDFMIFTSHTPCLATF